MEFIKPITIDEDTVTYDYWKTACEDSEQRYIELLDHGCKPEEARTVLNNSLKTEIRVTMNIRSLRNFFSLRCDKAAHPHMKEITIPLLLSLKSRIPVVFDDISYDEKFAEKYNLKEFDKYVTYYSDYVTENKINRDNRGVNLLDFMETLPDEEVDKIETIKMIYHPKTHDKWYIKYTIGDIVNIHWLKDNRLSDLSYDSEFDIISTLKDNGFNDDEISVIVVESIPSMKLSDQYIY